MLAYLVGCDHATEAAVLTSWAISRVRRSAVTDWRDVCAAMVVRDFLRWKRCYTGCCVGPNRMLRRILASEGCRRPTQHPGWTEIERESARDLTAHIDAGGTLEAL